MDDTTVRDQLLPYRRRYELRDYSPARKLGLCRIHSFRIRRKTQTTSLLECLISPWGATQLRNSQNPKQPRRQ
ncbi:hypothetical protein GCM10011410_30860 [Hoyosella rhizosphaerae]|uniref:Uncharacterized protein n=1 Tax=Hoyosella rhizosphaerae TaxID=1755582 RepID=A0A916XJP0_9ACTN|nr:hypothetical protein GCM10011410_30860 [Hoyosella rhizosphaerae]